MAHDDDYVTRHLRHLAMQPVLDAPAQEKRREIRRTHGRSSEDALREVTSEDIMRLHDETMQVLDRWMNGGPN